MLGFEQLVDLLIAWISEEDDLFVQHVSRNREHLGSRFLLVNVDEFDFEP